MTRSIHALRPAWLLARLRLRRAFNQMQALSRYRAGSPDRKAVSRKSPTAGLLSALLAVTMLASFTFLAYQGIRNIESALGSVQMQRTAPVAGNRATRPQSNAPSVPRHRAAAPGSVLSDPVLHAVAFEATLILVTVLSIMLAGRDFARPEWDLEWLATLPLPLPTLLLCRLIERVFTSASGMLGLLPFLSVVAWTCGYRWTAPLLGIALTLALVFIAATIQLMVDTGLRLSLSPPKLKSSCGDFPRQRAAAAPRHVHGHPANAFVFDWAPRCRTGRWARPASRCERSRPGWHVGARVVHHHAGRDLFFVTAGLLLLQRQLRDGVVAAGRARRSSAAARRHIARGLALARRAPRSCRPCSAGSCACSRRPHLSGADVDTPR